MSDDDTDEQEEEPRQAATATARYTLLGDLLHVDVPWFANNNAKADTAEDLDRGDREQKRTSHQWYIKLRVPNLASLGRKSLQDGWGPIKRAGHLWHHVLLTRRQFESRVACACGGRFEKEPPRQHSNAEGMALFPPPFRL